MPQPVTTIRAACYDPRVHRIRPEQPALSVRATVRQFRDRLDEYLTNAVEQGEPCVVWRRGKDYVVVVKHEDWEMFELGRRLDALGPEYRVSQESQRRAEKLLAKQSEQALSKNERRELNRILLESDEVLLRRAQAMEQL